MYREFIEINPSTPKDILEEIKKICSAAHKNRAGEVSLKTLGEYSFCFEGNENDYGCLMLASLSLNNNKVFKSYIKSWLWEDEEPEENCDILKSLAMPIVV